MFLVCHVISQDHTIKGIYYFWVGAPQVTTLLRLVTSLLVVCSFALVTVG